jgi:hypothetical protein
MNELEEEMCKLGYRHTDAEGESVLYSIHTIRLNQVKFAIFVVASVILAAIPLLLINW